MSKSIKDQGDEIRRELENLIGPDESLDMIDKDPELPAMRPQQSMVNYTDMKSGAEKKAKKTIESLMKFYLDQDLIDNNEYVKAKQKIDEMTMASLVYQLQAGERALTTLLETIDGGELSPRMFEVLATLQKSMLDIIKSQTMYLMAAEESVKRISRDAELFHQKTNKEITGGGAPVSTEGATVQRGTKDLMRAIAEGMKLSAEDIEETSAEEIKTDIDEDTDE
jgi:hypothetical protein